MLVLSVCFVFQFNPRCVCVLCCAGDERNEKSVASAKGHGGVYEGTLRSQFIYKTDGFRRNSAYFSWLDTEWPTVKAMLIKKMENKAAALAASKPTA